MLDNDELDLYNKTLINKKFKEIVLTKDGLMVIFEDELVMKFWSQGHDNFEAEVLKRVPSYRYDSIV